MAKSQINSLSKRQILESLMYEQNQSNATLSRLITAVARTAGLDADKLAEIFIDDKANQEYVEKFNVGVKEKHAARAAAAAPAPVADEIPPVIEEVETPETEESSEEVDGK